MDPAEQESLLELQRNTSSRSRRESADTSDYYRKFKMRLRYYIPIVGWLPKYTLESFQNDLTAGLTVASLIIPQSLSYAQALVRVPPVLGLVSAFITQFIYATLGTSRQLAVGPEALVSILVGSTIYEFRSWRDANPQLFGFDDEIDQYLNIQATALLCLLVGIFTLTVGIFRLGFLDSILSRALLRGFVLAVACVVMIDMSETMLGLIPPKNQCTDTNGYPRISLNQAGLVEPSSPFQLLLQILSNLSNAHLLTSTISVCSVAFLFGARVLKAVFAKRKWVTLIPEILVLVVVTTLLTQFFRWDCQGLAILNDIQTSIPKNVETFPKPTSAKIKHLMLPSMLITVIGFVESIAVAKTYASRHGYGVSPNRELVAIGTAS